MKELISKQDVLNEIVRFSTEEGASVECQQLYCDVNNMPSSNILPKNATNGDAIKAIFPDVEVKERNNGYEVYFGVGTAVQFFNHQWWNASYKTESEVKE